MQESLGKRVKRREREGNKKIHLLRSVEISQVGVQDIGLVQELKNKWFALGTNDKKCYNAEEEKKS